MSDTRTMAEKLRAEEETESRVATFGAQEFLRGQLDGLKIAASIPVEQAKQLASMLHNLIETHDLIPAENAILQALPLLINLL